MLTTLLDLTLLTKDDYNKVLAKRVGSVNEPI
jgi:hypothetical protein